MSFNGSGTFLINTAGQPVVSGTVISSTAFNALTADLATGLSTAITKDGQTTVTANIPMSTYKFTGLGVGSAATDSANLSQVQSTVTKLLTSVSGTDTITAVGAPVVAAYAAGQMFYFVATGDNTGAVTLNIDSLGAKAVTRDGSVALVAGDIKSGEVVVVVYDGTRFQVVSQLNSAGNATFANVSITSALNVGGVATLSGNLVFNSTAQRITADMSNATVSNRFAFQTSTTNGNTQVNAIPNGTSTTSQFIAYNNADPNNASSVQLAALSTTTRLLAGQTGTGSYLPITFFTNGSEQARLDTSGNLGLGVTPSAWSSGKAYETNAAGHALWALSNEINVTQNAYFNAGWKYGATAAAARYQQQSGEHKWHIAASGTVNTAITFTQALTLDASGNLQLGTTTNKTTAFSGNGTGMTIGASLAPMIALWDTSAATNVATLGQIDADTYLTNSANGVMVFSTNNTERARITAAGDFGIGTSSPAYKLDVNGNIRQSSTALVTAVAGLWEYDGSVNYVTPSGTQRGVVPGMQYYALNASLAGANVNTAQSVLGVGVTLSSNTRYAFEAVYALSKTAGTTSHTTGIGFGGTATINNIGYWAQAGSINSNGFLDLSNSGSFQYYVQTAANTVLNGAQAQAATFRMYKISGTVSVGTGGTFIPQYTLSAAPGGAYTTAAGCWFLIYPIGAAGSNVSVGTWA